MWFSFSSDQAQSYKPSCVSNEASIRTAPPMVSRTYLQPQSMAQPATGDGLFAVADDTEVLGPSAGQPSLTERAELHLPVRLGPAGSTVRAGTEYPHIPSVWYLTIFPGGCAPRPLHRRTAPCSVLLRLEVFRRHRS